MLKSRRKALKTLTQGKVVNIGDYRSLKNGRTLRKVGLVTNDRAMSDALYQQIEGQAELISFDNRFSLEQALKAGEWDGILLDERLLEDDALALCEKVKKQNRLEDLFVIILSDHSEKDRVRVGYEKGCDEWITRLNDVSHLARLLGHHLVG